MVCITNKKIPNKWASAICVSRVMMSDNYTPTGFGLHTISDEVMEYCSQIADAISSGDVMIDVDDGEDW